MSDVRNTPRTEEADFGRPEHERALRALWRELAEKRIESGTDWPGIAQVLFRDLDEAATTEAVLRGEIRRAEAALATFEEVVDQRDTARSRLTSIHMAAERASRKGYDLDPEDVLQIIKEEL